jgi:hypothetical protein
MKLNYVHTNSSLKSRLPKALPTRAQSLTRSTLELLKPTSFVVAIISPGQTLAQAAGRQSTSLRMEAAGLVYDCDSK